jgi:hypothetical protein
MNAVPSSHTVLLRLRNLLCQLDNGEVKLHLTGRTYSVNDFEMIVGRLCTAP